MTNAPHPEPPPAEQGARPWMGAAALAALLPFVGLVGGWTVAGSLQAADYDAVAESVSALAATTTPYRWIMQAGLVAAAAGWLAAAVLLPGVRRPARLLMAVGGAATVGVVLTPMASRSESSAAHVAFAVVAFVALSLWPLWSTPTAGRPAWPQRRAVATTAAIILSLLTAALLLPDLTGSETFGLWERVLIAAQTGWLVVVASAAWWAAGRPVAHRGRRLLLLAPLVAAAGLGGVVATIVAPTTVQTRHYSAEITLSLDPGASSRITAPTVFGDISVGFRGVAPGLVIRPQVRDTITDVLAAGTSDLSVFEPTPEEVDAVISTAVRGLAIRFGLGALAAALLVAGLEAVLVPIWRRRDSVAIRLRRVVAPSLAAAVVAVVGTGAAARETYDADRTEAFGATGLIGYLKENQNLLRDYETRARQVSPYIRNLLALSSALQNRYGPTADRPVALRVLLVSDIHDANVYELARTIIDEERIDAVLDLGDIVNFGRVEELEAAGIPRGIASLGVPYLFVRGNHDAVSATDDAILRRLERVPNVILLQPDSDTYTQVGLGGLRIAGFNDPRYYGDSGVATGQAQEPARDAFAATFADRPPVDIIAAHHPSAVRGLGGSALVVNGHMHSRALDGNRIQVGTFSGGGPFSHFFESAPGEELKGQPSAFDILDFGTDCHLVSLRRYTFRNAVEGRPVLDDVSLLNGSFIEATPFGDEPRECTAAGTATTEPVARSAQAPVVTPTATTPAPAPATPSGDPSPWTSLTASPTATGTP